MKAGLQRNILSGAGKTYFSVDYMNQNNANVTLFGRGTLKETDVEKRGVQVVRGIDAAAMKLYASYRNQSSDHLANDLFNYTEEAVMVGVNIDF